MILLPSPALHVYTNHSAVLKSLLPGIFPVGRGDLNSVSTSAPLNVAAGFNRTKLSLDSEVTEARESKVICPKLCNCCQQARTRIQAS